ncbi:hypothetical protein [Streptomyces sp. FH025]|uniref:hypothetical protein n=1 Tax=Streptomyces sp. FH025 TaxID=2815937 RepID=UPI001A9E9DFD|nr:hypothetical protein [Streptomyces sp. FH025]MBO1414535.1 hypothetical protein [Streptomyces sp. FH025]
MSTDRGRRLSFEERQERERAWSAEQKERGNAWTAEFEQRRKASAAEALVTSTAAEREAWARGERAGRIGYLDVTGPDGRRVRLAVVWLGRFRATSKPLNDYDPLRGVQAYGDGFLLLIPLAALLGLNFALRWAVLRLLDRPRWAVAAAVGPYVGTSGNNLVPRRFRARREALRYAAALADEVERDGEAALTAR